MRRREFMAGLGIAAAWPVAARAQQAVPAIGYLDLGSPDTRRDVVDAVHRGLSESGYIEGRNLAIEYRWAPEDRVDQLPGLAADLVRRRVVAILALPTPAALAAKAATKAIPIIFSSAVNPVEAGLVASLSRPGGNLTGMTGLIVAVAAKRLELLHELVPTANLIAYLVNPSNAAFAEPETKEIQAAARTVGVRLLILNASDPSDFERAFVAVARERAGGLVVSGASIFTNFADQLAALAARYGVPAIYARREGTTAGGLMSYGTDFPEMYRQVGIYCGRILKGEKPAELPVQQATKMEMAINLKTAKALGLTFPLTLLGRADEVIE
jgi:putative tryptophan/tyrosine transport system substrate-binding protein